MKTTRIVIIVLGVFIAAALLAFGLGQNKEASSEHLRIGAVLPLTGDIAFVGEEVKKGIDLALAEVNKDGEQIEVLYEDDAFDPKQSLNAATKLINIDKVDAVVTMIVEEAQPIMPLFASARVPLLVLWDSNRLIDEGGDYVFSNGFSTERAATDLAEYAYRELGLRTIAIIGHVNPWAEISTASFTQAFEKLGGRILLSEVLQVDAVDYRTVITKAKTLNPDGVYFPLIPPHNARFLIQAEELGLKSVFLTGDPLIQDSIVEAGSAAENVYFTNFYTDKVAELTTKYKSVYGTDPLDPALVSFGYDGVVKLLEAKETDVSLKSGLDKIFGPTRTVDRAERIYQVRQGVPHLVQ